MSRLEKDASVLDTLTALQARLGDSLIPIDHWEADLMAVGVARSDSPGRVVYFSTYGHRPNRYYVDLEFPAPAGSELPYTQGEQFDDVDFDALLAIVARHLSLDEPPPKSPAA